MAHTLAFVHSVNRRWAVAPDGPNDAECSCCHVQPDVATNTIAAGDLAVTVATPATTLRPRWRSRNHALE